MNIESTDFLKEDWLDTKTSCKTLGDDTSHYSDIVGLTPTPDMKNNTGTVNDQTMYIKNPQKEYMHLNRLKPNYGKTPRK